MTVASFHILWSLGDIVDTNSDLQHSLVVEIFNFDHVTE